MASADQSHQSPLERSIPDAFESFDLSIERIGEAYRAQVTDSPMGQTPSVAIDASRLDATPPSQTTSDALTRDVHRRPIDRDDLRHIGERLFRALFVDVVAETFRGSVERVRNHGIGLRIRLQLDDAPELATLPWEALWDPTDRAFLNDQPDLPVARALRVKGKAAGLGSDDEPPLRLLALLPEPRGESKLSGTHEWQQIQDQLKPLMSQGLVVVERLEPATLDALGKRIDKAACDVLHVVAHGGPGEPGAGGLLKLEDPEEGLDIVTGGDLARALERRKPPRLVVLNACHVARAAIDDAFDGMAQHLVSRGVPAVVAMRTSISDAAAVSFAVALYRALASGKTIEAAMVEARRRISLGEHRTEWATPVLYLRGDNVRIFDTGTVEVLIRKTRRNPWPAIAAIATAIAIGLLTVLMWPEALVDPCPPPPGLQDLRFVKIEPGVVDLGDRKVTVEEAYCIGTKEVSRRDWLEVMGGSLPRDEWPLDWPMTYVTPDEANAFLQMLESRDPGVTYRLPTAEQWEYASRANQKTEYFFGNDPSKLHRYANCNNYLGSDEYDGPAPVGSFEPNPWGLYDVHGNVAEWVTWPEETVLTDEANSVEDTGNRIQAPRLGGSLKNKPSNCTFSGGQSAIKAGRDEVTGFRVVRLLKTIGDE